ncbi:MULTISPECIES: hypothetical protein [Enterobacter cloacae complex]|uniref:Uncharacterized protein n=1 Tax=Enterobacter roggenkampii TaxID=1812935 RepID=A0A837LKQ8_9ENTR|nr:MULTISPECIES: hypothetical protein [Enterobacter cloacae complex]KLQ07018.1 hypothetical protein ABF77_04025 [Enterobacter roggenkampii]BCP69648.1 hypothetical protein R1N_18350 [Enterobacter asburiae]HDX4632580.1 hypothetical protein [Enterobacter asburiae]HDX4676253.1 hypothetical protein [Enterobacter asburiae]
MENLLDIVKANKVDDYIGKNFVYSALNGVELGKLLGYSQEDPNALSFLNNSTEEVMDIIWQKKNENDVYDISAELLLYGYKSE